MPSSYTRLKGVINIGESLVGDQLVTNTISFLEWGFLNAGGFYNVNKPASGVFGGSQNRLRLVADPNYAKGKVWEGFRSNWVWESGINYSSQPIRISGVYLNNNFLPIATTGTYAYTINYPFGRVVFNNALPATSVLEINYSYRYINIYDANNPWFKEIQFNSFRLDDSHFELYGSGTWSILAENRVQLPAIIVEAVPRRTMKPRQLGGGQFVYQDMLFHIFAETDFERSQLVDAITFQKNVLYVFFDKNTIMNSGYWPIRYDGALTANALCYPDLVNRFNMNRGAYIIDSYSQETESLIPGLYEAIVRSTAEIECPEL